MTAELKKIHALKLSRVSNYSLTQQTEATYTT